MNKTVTVNIGGIVFHIDENAYERFKAYLESIRLHFTTAEGRDEIMQDIESRIAEMFQERISDGKQVITLSDVDEVTNLMGRPEQFSEGEEKEESTKATSQSSDAKEEPVQDGPTYKRLYRNPDDKVAGGVCSGIAAYFDVDPVWIRLIFAFFFFVYGSGFGLYILLWIIVPEAESSLDKLKMRGAPMNISNIEKNVREGSEQKKQSLTSRIFEGFASLIKYFFLFIGKIIAVFFMFIGLVVGIAFCFSLLAIFRIPGTHIPEFVRHVFPDGFQFNLAFICAVLLLAIPFLMLAYAGAKMLFNIKRTNRVVGFTALGLWLGSLAVCLVLGVSIAREFSESTSIHQAIPVAQPAGKAIRLEALGERQNSRGNKYYDRWDKEDWDEDFFLTEKDGYLQSGDIHLDIVRSYTDSFQIEQINYSRGSSKKDAAERASHISYSLTQMDSVLRFNRLFQIDRQEKFRGQRVQLILKMPLGSEVYLDKSLDKFIYDVDNVKNILDHDMLGKNWRMTEKGLTCMDCSGEEATVGGSDDNDTDIDLSEGDHHIQINDKGVVISGTDDEGKEAFVKIDSTGVQIKSNGKLKKIK
jgi:phage shock protein PspC (stress-responsive transcriptional regulator)